MEYGKLKHMAHNTRVYEVSWYLPPFDKSYIFLIRVRPGFCPGSVLEYVLGSVRGSVPGSVHPD